MDKLNRLAGRTWGWAMGSEVGRITTRDLAALYAFIAASPEGRSGSEIASFLGVSNMSHRKADRSVQCLRRFGLARFDGPTRRWVTVTDEGGR